MPVEKQPSFPQDSLGKLTPQPNFEADLKAEFEAEPINDGGENWSELDDFSFGQFTEAETFEAQGKGQLERLELEVQYYLKEASSEEKIDLATENPEAAYRMKLYQLPPLLTKEEEVELSKKIQQGSLPARNELVERNLRLAYSIAKKFYKPGEIDFLELVQQGNLGLIMAAKKFKWEKDVKFATYATWWIRKAIIDYLKDRTGTISLPRHIQDDAKKIRRTEDKHEQEEGERPTLEAIAKEVGMSENRVRGILRYRRITTDSLASPVSADSKKTLEDKLESEDDIEEIVEKKLRSEELRRLVDSLPEQEKKAIELKFGLKTGQPLLTKEIGPIIGLHPHRAGMLINRVLSELRERQQAT